VDEIMFEERKKYNRLGKKVYIVPEGGSSTLGIWGYINAVEELNSQLDFSSIKGILTASGSGGTSAGLLVGAALLGLDIKVYAVTVLYSAEKIRTKILNLAKGCIREYNLHCNIDENNLVVLDGYSYEGYKKITHTKLTLIKKFARETGIILDPAYTGKAFKAYHENFISKGKGKQVLFIHTGGLFSVFAKKDIYLKS
ncbi:MAG: pyridoxal-phosphate dependent enzyme, partial [Ignavibacteriaceae bacterium]|nr:pyridoxal-phosphate dependent enzyme [Ignavibacteriaceae bacterium]